MRVAIAVTHESVLSVVASAWELIDFCARMRHADGADAQVFAVSSEPAELFRKRYGFIELLDSRLSAPADWVFVPGLAGAIARGIARVGLAGGFLPAQPHG